MYNKGTGNNSEHIQERPMTGIGNVVKAQSVPQDDLNICMDTGSNGNSFVHVVHVQEHQRSVDGLNMCRGPVDTGNSSVHVVHLQEQQPVYSVHLSGKTSQESSSLCSKVGSDNSIVHISQNQYRSGNLASYKGKGLMQSRSLNIGNSFAQLTNLEIDPSTVDRGCDKYMNWSFWNVRGLNKSSKQHLVKHHLQQYHLSFLALLETKIKAEKISIVAKRLSVNWKWVSNASSTSKARIILLWDPNILEVLIESLSDQQITCKVKSLDGRIDCVISSIYGQNQVDKRRELWLNLTHIYQTVSHSPWLLCGDFNAIIGNEEKLGGTILSELLCGDFNAIIGNEEKLGGTILSEADTSEFREFIDFCHLSHLKTEGCFYTWNNKQDAHSRIWSRLDRALINDAWLQKYNSSHVEYLLQNFSDHSPGLVSIYDDCAKGKKPFKFFKMCAKHKSFLPTVSRIWQTKVKGYAMYSVYTKMKLLKNELKELNKRHFSNISEQGKKLTDEEKIISEFISFYKNLMGTNSATANVDRNIISNGPCLSEAQARALSNPVTREEIKEAVFSMSENKAPGPDGYSISFYKSAWGVVGDEISLAIEDFFKTGKLLGEINSTAITLIPKIQCPKSPVDFRPIACCNCLYKFISKILANRIKSVMGFLVNEAQNAFVKGRQISSNILLAHELAKNYNRKYISPRAMLNIDIKKAFDTINWGFLKEMLTGLGFPDAYVGWIMACITSPKYSIAFNGALHGYFKGERGLRQGDPLSPYLFILGMEYLSRRLELLKEDRNFKFHPKCKKFQITHLIFVDDLLLFSKGDLYSVNKLYQCFSDFCAVSGLKANSTKCSIFYGGVEDPVKASIFNCLGACKNHKKLSYAGRLQIIKSSILGIQVFWTSNYILPVRVLKKIDELCRHFLWGKYDQSAKTVPAVSWEKVCLDKEKGGLGIFSASIWNLASAVKLLWHLHINKEGLWIKWVNGTYLKNCNVWQVQAKRGDLWMWKQILRARDKAVELSGNVDNLKQMIKASSNSSKIKIAEIYSALSPASNSVPWHNMVWGGLSYPKHSFICWLAVNNRLQTQDRLLRQGIVNANKCKLCTGPCLESRDHLFFECSFSKEVWNQIMDWLLFKWRSCSWNSIINWYCTNLRKKGIKQNIKRAALSATIYHIWYERNMRMFQQLFKSEESLVKRIKVDILTICINSPNIAGNLTDWISPV
ncbi:uncharacterized protein LOC109831293 [Asparagus officinalis]|uniref:uncharacterized protein LOC109831293 n=1 Tax=Asparagus officinalis TaxID=4686 RepID=UPI00098E348B|nr:uncharacterized protein LOC109831293 [Asparagus officinalis]